MKRPHIREEDKEDWVYVRCCYILLIQHNDGVEGKPMLRLIGTYTREEALSINQDSLLEDSTRSESLLVTLDMAIKDLILEISKTK